MSKFKETIKLIVDIIKDMREPMSHYYKKKLKLKFKYLRVKYVVIFVAIVISFIFMFLGYIK